MKTKVTTQNLVIPAELSKSFVKDKAERSVSESEFIKWFSEIRWKYHPINNYIFDM